MAQAEEGPVMKKLETWWDDHPFFRKFYVPLVLTATLVMTIIDAVTRGGH